jgi:tetratricopeptide (TPR) repeat protein
MQERVPRQERTNLLYILATAMRAARRRRGGGARAVYGARAARAARRRRCRGIERSSGLVVARGSAGIMRPFTSLFLLTVAVSSISHVGAKGTRKRKAMKRKAVSSIDWRHTTRRSSADDKVIKTLRDLMQKASKAHNAVNIGDAVAMYEEGLRVYPDFEFAHYNLGELLFRAGEKHQAKSLQHLERAYDLMATDDPKRFLTGPKRLAALRSCIARLGKIYSSQGKLEKESALYERAVTQGVFRDQWQRPANFLETDLPLDPWPGLTEWPALAQVKTQLEEAHAQIKEELLHADNTGQFFVDVRAGVLDSSSPDGPTPWQVWNYMHNGKSHRDHPDWQTKLNSPPKLTGGTDIVLWKFSKPGVRWNPFMDGAVRCSDGTIVKEQVTADENNQVPPNEKGTDRLLLVNEGTEIILEKKNMTANTNYTFEAQPDMVLEAHAKNIIRLPEGLMKPVVHMSAADFNPPKSPHLKIVEQRLKSSEQFETAFPKTKAVIDKIVALAGKDLPHATVEFALLRPGTRTQPMCGSANHKFRVVLGVFENAGVSIRVGDPARAKSTRPVKEGEVLIFDEVSTANSDCCLFILSGYTIVKPLIDFAKCGSHLKLQSRMKVAHGRVCLLSISGTQNLRKVRS